MPSHVASRAERHQIAPAIVRGIHVDVVDVQFVRRLADHATEPVSLQNLRLGLAIGACRMRLFPQGVRPIPPAWIRLPGHIRRVAVVLARPRAKPARNLVCLGPEDKAAQLAWALRHLRCVARPPHGYAPGGALRCAVSGRLPGIAATPRYDDPATGALRLTDPAPGIHCRLVTDVPAIEVREAKLLRLLDLVDGSPGLLSAPLAREHHRRPEGAPGHILGRCRRDDRP